jgi:hypothetical protein
MSWEVAPDILVRTTGFPVEHLERLRMPAAAAAVRALHEAEGERDSLRQRLLKEVFPPLVASARATEDSSLKRLYSVRRAVGRHHRAEPDGPLPPPAASELERWNRAIAECESRAAAARFSWTGDLAKARAALRSFGADHGVREAIAVSNPSFLAELDRHLARPLAEIRPNRERRFERRLALYAQRLCAKNETASFFGPLNYGQVESGSQRIEVEAGPPASLGRRAYPAHWMAEALAAAISADPAMGHQIRPRRGTLWRAESQSRLRNVATDAVRTLSPAEAALWRAADGRTAIAALAAACRVQTSRCRRLVAALREEQILVAALLVPSDREDPLVFLRERLEGDADPAASRWRREIAAISRLVATLPDGSITDRLARRQELRDRFARLTGLDPERGAGEAYADRDLSFEECRGSIRRLVISRQFAAELTTSLAPLLRLLHALAEERRAVAREVAERVFAAVAGGGDRIAFLRFVLAARRAAPGPAAPGPLEGALRELIAQRRCGALCSLTAGDLNELLPSRVDPASCSVDLMLAAPGLDTVAAGDARLVVGEVHPPALLHTFPAAAFNAAARGRIARLLDGDDRLAELLPARKTKLFPYPLPGPQIELRPLRPTCDATPVAAVDVVRTEHGLELQADSRPIQLRPPLEPGDGIDVLLPFSQPALTTLQVDLGEQTPRIEVDQVIVQRRRWRVRPELPPERAGDFERFLAYRTLARDLELPDQVFAHSPGEPKPVAVDFGAQFSVEILDGLLRQNQELVLTEALPSLEDAWLKLGDGRHTSELRILFIDPAPDK